MCGKNESGISTPDSDVAKAEVMIGEWLTHTVR